MGNKPVTPVKILSEKKVIRRYTVGEKGVFVTHSHGSTVIPMDKILSVEINAECVMTITTSTETFVFHGAKDSFVQSTFERLNWGKGTTFLS